jgi:predicted ATPase
VIPYIRQLLKFRENETPEVKLHKLEQGVRAYGFSLDEAVPLLAALLSVPLLDRYPPLCLSPQQQRQRTLETLVAWLLEEAQRQPVLAVWEDLHWTDPSTLEMLSLLVDQVPTARMMILLTFRPEFYPPWIIRSHLTQITLSRLGSRQVEQMVAHLTHGKAFPSEVLQQVIDKTDGVPLFVEELIKMVLESGLVREEENHYELTGPLPPLAIPSTLQDSLMARLDRLGTAKEVAQLGATLGRDFPYELVQAVAPMDEPTLQHGLAQLVAAELLYKRGLPPRVRYLFKHALIQETAYQSLLKSTRQHYHQRIAEVLATRFPEMVETQPELLAHHYTEAGLSEQAIPYWQQAGQRGIERSANLEAIGHLTKGLELLKALPETPERARYELALQLALGSPLLMIKGDTAPEVEHTYTRAQALCQQVGDSRQRFLALGGLWRFYLNRPRLQMARELGEQCFILAQSLQDPACLLEAHLMLGSTLLFLGEPVLALEHLEQGLTLYDRRQSHTRAFSSGTDPGVLCLSRAAWTLWMLGYPDQALIKGHEALALAEEVSHAFSLAVALQYAAVLHQSRREPQLVRERAEATIALASEQGFPYWLGVGKCMRGWALAEQGAAEAGIEQLRQGMGILQAMGSHLAKTHLLLRLAEVYGKAGQAEEALRVLEEALAAVHENSERYFEAELYRLKGELLLQQASGREALRITTLKASIVSEADTCLRQALEIARSQGARSLELRAVMSLARLWLQQGHGLEARQLLEDIYGGFAEGFDTLDLQEAKALLAALT